MKSKLNLFFIFAIGLAFIASCEPDNPLRGEPTAYSFYGIGSEGGSIFTFTGKGEVGGNASAVISGEGQNASLDLASGKYFILRQEPASLIKLDTNNNIEAEIALGGGPKGTVHYINATTAFYHPEGTDVLEIVDIFFNKSAASYTLPFVPRSIISIKNEFSGNRIILLGSEGQLGYFDVRDYIYKPIAETGISDAILIERPLTGEFYLVGSENEKRIAVKYDSETGAELSRNEIFTSVGSGADFLTGIWGGANIGYAMSDTGFWILQDINGQLGILPTSIDIASISPDKAIAKTNFSTTGISFLMNNSASSHFLSFKDGAVSGATPVQLDRRVVSYEPID